MKSLWLFLMVLWAGAVSAQTTPSGNPSAASAAKLSLTSPWQDVTVKMLVPGSSGPPMVKSNVVELPAKLATYNKNYSVLAFDDPYTNMTYILNGYENKRGKTPPSKNEFYLSQDSGPIYCYEGSGHLLFGSTYVQLPTKPGSISSAIAKFEAEYDPGKLDAMLREMVLNKANKIDLMTAVPLFYFSDAPAPGGTTLSPDIESLDLTDGILRMNVRNPRTKIPATFWIDLKARKVIESVVDGQQMDLTTGKPFAVPLGQAN